MACLRLLPIGCSCLALALAVAALGCGDDAGAGGQGGSAAGGAPAATYASEACGECVVDGCKAAIDACQSDSACAAYVECLLGCPVTASTDADPACDAACRDASGNSESAQLRAQFTACRYYGAGQACSACGYPTVATADELNQVCTPHREMAPTPCRACYWERCCETWDACFDGNNPDCDALSTCIQECPGSDEACVTACFAAHPDSSDTLLSQVSCSVAECAADQVDCAVEDRDACDVCLFEDCGDPFVAMLADLEGYLMFTCTAACGANDGGTECIQACGASHPDGLEPYYLWAECIAAQCSASC